MPQTIFVQMDVQVMTWLQNEATTLFADRKSLPKMRKTREKGRDSQFTRPEISTQTAENLTCPKIKNYTN